MTAGPKILAFDLENTAMTSQHWGRWNQNIQPIATLEESRVLCFGAKWVGGSYVFKATYEHGRQEMLDTIWELLTEADAVVSWNGVRHDSKKIRHEFLLEEMTPPAKWQELDLMKVAKSQFAFSSNSLNHVSQQLGIGEKIIHEGFYSIIPKVLSGDETARRKFAQYQKQDVLLLEKLLDRFRPWIPNYPNYQAFASDPDACPFCGNNSLQKRGFLTTSIGKKQKYCCTSCGAWSHGKSLLTTSEIRV